MNKRAQTGPAVEALRVRRASIADLDVIEHNINSVCKEDIFLVSSFFVMPKHWRRILSSGGELNNDLIVVADVDGRVVGHGRMFSLADTSAHVADLGMAIIAGFRNLHIGSRMIAYMLDWARQKRLHKITLGVLASNARAIHVYEKFGFVVEGVLAQQHRIGEQIIDKILMARFL